MISKVLTVKRGRPSKYSNRIPKRVVNYTNACLKSGDYPTIEQLAIKLGVVTRTIYDWEKDYEEFLRTTQALRDIQKHLLLTNGLNDKYNSRFATFLLKATHGMSDSRPIFEANQNNYFNVSPEILADAIEITRARKKESTSDLNLIVD